MVCIKNAKHLLFDRWCGFLSFFFVSILFSCFTFVSLNTEQRRHKIPIAPKMRDGNCHYCQYTYLNEGNCIRFFFIFAQHKRQTFRIRFRIIGFIFTEFARVDRKFCAVETFVRPGDRDERENRICTLIGLFIFLCAGTNGLNPFDGILFLIIWMKVTGLWVDTFGKCSTQF